MLKRYTKLDQEKRFALIGIIIWLLIFSFFIGFQIINKESHAIGGGWIGLTGTVQTVNATTTANTISTGTQNLALIKGVYIVIFITTLAPAITVTSISDTQSNTYTLAVQSDKFEDNEIWYANYTGTNFGADTVTVHYSASTSAIVIPRLLTGVNSGTIQTVKNNGTSATASVASFTPNNNYACGSYIAVDSGSTTGTTFTTPNFWYLAAAFHLGTTVFDSQNQLNNNWANYGSTTDSTAMTPTSSPQWDMTIACFPAQIGTTTTTTTSNGMSGGIVQEKNSTTVLGIKISLTFDYKPQKYDLLLDVVYVQTNTNTVNIPTDTNSLTWKIIGQFRANQKNIQVFGANFTKSSSEETINQTLTLSNDFQIRIFELTGITTNWNTTTQFLTNSGTTSTSSLPSFKPPQNWFLLGTLIYNISDTNAHTWNTSRFTEYNSNLTTMQNRMNGTQDWSLADYFPEWNTAIMGTDTAPITPSSPTGSNWIEMVLELPTQTSGIVTNTLTSTTSTTTTTISSTTTTTTSITTNTSSTTIGFAVNTVTTIPVTYFELIIWIALLVIPIQKFETKFMMRLFGVVYGFVVGADCLAGTRWINIIGNTFTLVQFDDGTSLLLSVVLIFVSVIMFIYSITGFREYRKQSTGIERIT